MAFLLPHEKQYS